MQILLKMKYEFSSKMYLGVYTGLCLIIIDSQKKCEILNKSCK